MTHNAIYRSVQRLSQVRLEALLLSLKAQRESRVEVLRGFEERYVRRLSEEGFDPIARDIEAESGLAAEDRRLLLKELAVLDVHRRRRLTSEKKKEEAPDEGRVLVVSPEAARAMPDRELTLTNRRLKAQHDG